MKIYFVIGIVGLGAGLLLAELKIHKLEKNKEELDMKIEGLRKEIKEELKTMWEGDDLK